MRNKLTIGAGLAGTALVGALLLPVGPAAAATTPDVDIVVGDAVRSAQDDLALGYNVPWSHIQGVPSRPGSGIWDTTTRTVDAAVRDELRQSPGMTYRYPGGNPSNHFKWMQTVGPVSSRIAQYDPDVNASMIPDFGFDEFMAMVEDVDGEATLTVNMGDLSNNAAAWVEYANAPNNGSNSNGGTDWAAVRATNGHAAAYAVKRWELDNERDLLSHGGWSVETYIAKAKEFIPKMRAADPTIEIFAHAYTSPWGRTGDWTAWHKAIITELGGQIDGIVFHPYYDGIDVPTIHSYTEQIRDDAAALGHPELTIALTEHAKWPSDLGNRATWPATSGLNGAISSADMVITSEQEPVIDAAYWHSLAGLGPWQPFNGVDPATGDYSTSFTVRPIAEALAMIHDARLGDQTVLQTSASGPNTSGYAGGYDVSASASLSADQTELTIVAVNRGTEHAASVDLGQWDVSSLNSTVTVLNAASGAEPAARSTSAAVNALDANGKLIIALPAGSVSVHEIPVNVDNERPAATLSSPTATGPYPALAIHVDATDDTGLRRITGNIYQGSTLVRSTQSPAGGASSAFHATTVALADGAYTLRYNSQDLAGNISNTKTFDFTIDATKPTVTVKTGANETTGSNGSYGIVSFKLHDAGQVDKVIVNGVVKDLTNNAWSDVNYVKPGVFGAVIGANTMVVYDIAGNATTVQFTLQ